MNILIGTPAFHGDLKTRYFNSIFKLTRHFAKTRPHINFAADQIEATRVEVARNMLATTTLKNDMITHLLFVDADMGFEPSLIEKQIDEDKPITAAICPKRQLPLSFTPDTGLHPATMTASGFMKSDWAGAGVMLIQRSVFVEMRERFPELWCAHARPPYPRGDIFQCFAPLVDNTGLFLPEDISFSLRWTMLCKKEIWVCANEQIDHVGSMTFSGRYSDLVSP